MTWKIKLFLISVFVEERRIRMEVFFFQQNQGNKSLLFENGVKKVQ